MEIAAFLPKPLILHMFYKLFTISGTDFGTFGVPKCMVCDWFYNKNENLCYHGTGSEEGAREGVHGQQNEEVAWCKHAKHEDNKDSKEPIATQCILRKLLLTRDGPPRGDPGLGNSNVFPLLPVLPWAPVGFRTFARVMLRKRWANSF